MPAIDDDPGGRRTVLLGVAVVAFFVIVFASAAGIIVSKRNAGAATSGAFRAETAPTIPLTAGLDTTRPSARAKAAPPTTAPKPKAVAIDSFNYAAKVDCSDPTKQALTLSTSWKTSNATKVTISIDGPGVYHTYDPVSGDSLPFGCAGPHTYLLTAYGIDAKTTVTRLATVTS
jgi:hypothetical protein